jgi:TolB-like protein/DNA-binding winged helix-turn-helix (wHTH) protein/Flp pilus assembly protein TadD
MPGYKEPLTLIPFGPFEADVHTQELRKRGIRLRLPGQSFQILKMLLVRPGELVTREELRQALWPSDTFVDFEHGLNAAVNKLREALGDSADNPKYLETLPRRGYRFIAEVTVAAPESRPVSVQGKAPVGPVQGIGKNGYHGSLARRRGWLFVAAPVLLMAIVLVAMDVGGLRSKLFSGSAGQPQIRSLAVLPLTNISGDPGQEYFADGMTEELITELSRIGSLKVISRTSVMQYKGEKKKPLPQIGRELNVDAVMEGSVLRSGNRVRIEAHVIYAPTDQNLMVETYEREIGDVLKLQREVAESITQRVRLKLSPEQQARFSQAREVNPEAYEAFLKALSFQITRYREIKKSQSYLEIAIQKDPAFAPAYVELARTYRRLGEDRWLSPQDAFPSARRAARKALELDGNNCGAHWELGRVSWRYEWDWQTAERGLNRAIELCANDAYFHFQHAFYLGWSGRVAEAKSEAAKTRELDPLASTEVLQIEAVIDYHLSNYRSMIEAGRRYVESDAKSWVAHYFLGVGYEGSGQTLEAIPEYQKAVELSEGNTDAAAALAHAYATTDRRAEAQKILSEWKRQSETSYVSSYMIATVYASLGEKDRAFAYLEKAYQERSSDLPYFLKADLRMDSLRSDPRFQDLMRRMNFPKD